MDSSLPLSPSQSIIVHDCPHPRIGNEYNVNDYQGFLSFERAHQASLDHLHLSQSSKNIETCNKNTPERQNIDNHGGPQIINNYNTYNYYYNVSKSPCTCSVYVQTENQHVPVVKTVNKGETPNMNIQQKEEKVYYSKPKFTDKILTKRAPVVATLSLNCRP